MSNVYCGNNRLHKNLVNGISILGTRNQCLKKGIRLGINLPYDKNYLGEYEPIDPTKIYCGNNINLPIGYDRFGSIRECHQRGIGIGKRIKAKSKKRSKRRKLRSKRRKLRSKRRKRKS
jgi:hypothetical protein